MEDKTNPISRENATQTPPKNYLIESILVTILCCFPFGILGIINATKIENLHARGDMEGAEKATSEAKKNIKRAVIVGAIIWVLVIAYWIFTLVQMASIDGY